MSEMSVMLVCLTVVVVTSVTVHGICDAAEAVAKAVSDAIRYRWDLEFEIIDSPRMERERTPPPPPLTEDSRMDPFERWLASIEDPPTGKALENLRASYAIVVGVKKVTDAGRYARARETVEAHGCQVPENY